MELEGKAALITGGTTGIGVAIAEAFLTEGARVVITGRDADLGATPLDTPLQDFDRIMAVHVRGYFLYARACFPHLEARGGSMIHISSDAALLGEVEVGIYSVSKAAVNMLSNVLAIEGARRGVRSNAICPGDIEPGMRHMGPPEDPDRPEAGPAGWLLPPVGRIGRGADVAHAAVYLATDRASFVNGVVLPVDGGMRAGCDTAVPPDDS